jgi:hypothetical protein
MIAGQRVAAFDPRELRWRTAQVVFVIDRSVTVASDVAGVEWWAVLPRAKVREVSVVRA